MKRLLKTQSNKLLAILLVIMILISVLPINAVIAWTSEAGVRASSKEGTNYVSIDGGYYYFPQQMRNMIYDANGNISYISFRRTRPLDRFQVEYNGETIDAYCIEGGVSFKSSDNGYQSMNYDNSSYFQNLPYAVQYGIMLTTIYGYRNDVPEELNGLCNLDDFRYAAQIIIWEYQQQIRTSPTAISTNNGIQADMYYSSIQGRPAEHAYNWLLNKMNNHSTIPSFTAPRRDEEQTYTLKYNVNTNNYSLTLTDNNNTLNDIKLEDNSGVTVSRDGNKYTFTSSNMITEGITISAQKDINKSNDKMLVWGRAGYQTLVTGVNDPVRFYFKLNTETVGTAHIIKTSEDGKVEGIRFKVSGNGVNKTVVTGRDGTIDITDLMPGQYEITEEAEDKYIKPDTQKVTILSGQTSTVTFNNTLKRGKLEVTKTAEDGMVEGVKFHLYGTSLSQIAVDEYATTDNRGIATFDNVLISGTQGYTLEEVNTATRYVVPAKQTVTINWNETTKKTVNNILKKFNVTVTKTDVANTKAQGGASLAGADYGIFNNGELIDKYTTDENGQFTTSYYVCGDGWTIKELAPSEGYMINNTAYKVGAEAKLYTVEHNNTKMNVIEQVIKGKIALIKHNDNGETQIETPEVGSTFQMFLKSRGSYDKAKDSEKDILVCNEDGFAESKLVPYGIYTVHQISGNEGAELMKDFDVYISENGKTYKFLINNASFESYIKVVKVDKETGKIIPFSGTGFQIFDSNKKLITMQYTYPELTKVDTFYTNSEGYLITPEKLSNGTYFIKEVQAPYGYVLNDDFIEFKVTQDKSTQEENITVIEIKKSNIAQKGKITIKKTGEIFSTVIENEGIYQPVYKVVGLKGAKYEISADEDIYTLDGTLRVKKGEVVDTITTQENGSITSKELYLGKYKVKEIFAPYGTVLNTETQEIELTYLGQEIEVIENFTTFYDERQKVEISLNKLLEQDNEYGVGNNNEMLDVTFGLFADEDIIVNDNTMIPADGLIELISLSEKGTGTFKTDLPFGKYYIQEIKTNEAYKLNEEKYKVEFDYAGQDIQTVKIVANDGKKISNELIRGKIKGRKVTEDGENLTNAIIGIFKIGTTEFTTETAIKTTVSGKNGQFEFDEVPYGRWIIREIQSPEGFVLSEEEIEVVINQNEEEVEIEMINDYIRGNLELTKIDEEYPDNHLSGAIFEVYTDSNNNKELDEEDVLIGTLEEQDKGIYKMKDVKYGLVFIKETKAPYGFILDENVYSVFIDENGKTYTIENNAGQGFLNKAIKGSIKIVKSSEDGVLEGFTFVVTGTDFMGNYYKNTYITDENGEIFIDGLRIGRYTIAELQDESNTRYIIPEQQEINIEEDKTYEVSFENKLIEVPNTGDKGLYVWIMVLAISSASLIIVIIIRKIFKKKCK